MAGFGWAAGLVAALFWATPAWASTGGHLVYSAPPSCGGPADFEARVAERGGHFDAYAAPDSGRELRVAVIQTTHGYLGTFQEVGSEGASAIRELRGAMCSEVVAALAVVSAIALRGEDGAASEQEPTPATLPTPTSVPTPAPTSVPTPTPVPPRANEEPRATAPVANEKHLRASSAIAGSKEIEVPAGKLRFDTPRSITLFAGGELGILPSKVLPRYDLSISGASFVTTPDGKSFLAGVIPRLRVSYFGNGNYAVGSPGGFGSTYQSLNDSSDYATVNVRGVGVGLGLCWSPTYDTSGFVGLICAEYGLGVMELKSVSDVPVTAPYFTMGSGDQTKSSAFQTAGVSFEGEYRLGSFFHLALKLGYDASLQQLTAERVDGSQIFHSSTLLAYGMLGLGIHF